MDALARQEYPAMLAALPPAQAVSIFNERVKRIGKVNAEIADWLQERRKVEELYVQGLKKLAHKVPPDSQSELGIFTTPWQKIVTGTEAIAASHFLFATKIDKDVEQPLRSFVAKNREMQAIATMQGNLAAMAKQLEEAQDKSDKLSKKGGKSNAVKVDQAAQKLEAASSEWDSQAPFVFEKLQAVDETRLNQLRDLLTQYQTHETDQVERSRVTAESTLNSLLEVDTAVEIHNFANNATQGKPKLERKTHRTSSSAASSLQVPPSIEDNSRDNASQHSGKNEASSEPRSGLKRFGTMLGRRRQSIHVPSLGRASSPSKGFTALGGRGLSSREGRPAPSPRASSNNLRDPANRENRLKSVAETPSSPEHKDNHEEPSTNGDAPKSEERDIMAPLTPTNINGAKSPSSASDLSEVKAPPGPPPSRFSGMNFSSGSVERDSEGYTVRQAANDPISQAQLEAAAENEQQAFKLDIKSEAIQEEDADAQAALSNVAQTLRSNSLAAPIRKLGTVRGRRDVRNTMYIPAPEISESLSESPGLDSHFPASPPQSASASRAAALAALSAGDHGSVSDTQSIRSSHSLTSSSNVKHHEMHQPGLNSSIIEVVSALFENGELKNVSMQGELALAHVAEFSAPSPASATETVRLDNFPVLEAIAPNRAFVDEISPDRPGEYSINLAHLSKTNVAFKYKVHIDSSNLSTHVPILLKPAWRPQGDKLGVVIEYSLNPVFGTQPITLHNFILIATYEGARIAGCQTKPSGIHVKEKSLIYWRLGDVTLSTSPQKVIARLIGAEGAEPKPGMVEAKWEFHAQPGQVVGSGLGISRLKKEGNGKGKEKEEIDPFADESVAPSPGLVDTQRKWVQVESARRLVAGKFDAMTSAQ